MLLYAHANPRVHAFAEFIDVQRDRYLGDNDNRFAFAMECVFKRYRFAWSLKDRSGPLISKCIATVSAQMTAAVAGATQPVQGQAIAEHHAQSEEVLLLFECFLMYGSILCDELSYLLLHLFGECRGVRLGGHRLLSKNFAAYAAGKQLEHDPETSTLAIYLENELCDFRDKQIVHDFHPRKLDGVSWNLNSSDVCLYSAAFLYPKPSDSPCPSGKSA